MTDVTLLDTVTLVHDEPALNLAAGAVGVVVEVLPGDTFEVEFCGPNGEILGLHPLPATRLTRVSCGTP